MYVTILPETGKIADGIRKALRQTDDDVRQAAKRWQKEIEQQLKGIKVKIDAELKVDTEKAKKEIEKATRDQDSTVQVDADTGKAEAKITTVARDRKAKIKVEVDKQSLKKAGAQLKEHAGFGKGGIGIPGTRASVPPALGIEAIGLAPNVVPLVGSMVQAVGQLSGALALLPAAAGAGVLAFGALKIATAGFGDAMKNIGDVEKFNESVAALAPSMQVAARGIQTLLPQINQLKMTVGDAFGAGFADQVTKLGDTYLPIFQDVMSRMSQSAGVALGGIGKMLQTSGMQQDIKTFGANASQAFSMLLQAAQPLVKAFTDIATVGSSFLPQLAGTVGDLAKRFGDFIGEARESGKLGEWIQGGITAFTQLKDIAVNVWNIFKGVFDAAGGGDFLNTVVDITNTWSNWVNSIGGQNALRDFFEEAKRSWDEWWPIIKDTGIILYNAFTGLHQAADLALPIVKQIADLLAQYPGWVNAAAFAFGTWKLASIVQDITKIGTALLGLQATAATAGTGIRAGIASGLTLGGALTLPITLTIAGSALALWAGNKLLESGRDIALPIGDVGGTGLQGITNTANQGVTGNSLQGGNRTALPNPRQGPAYQPNIYGQGLPPQPHAGVTQQIPVVQPSPNALPDVSQQQAPPTSSYGPPPPMPSGGGAGGGGGGGAAGAPQPPPGMSWTYSGFGELNWEALAQAESGGNWNANTGNGFFGGLQFVQSTWEAYGGKSFADRADLADKSDQIKVATALYNKEGAKPWPDNGWLLTASPDQLNAAGLTGSGRQSTSGGTRGRGGGGGGGGGWGGGGNAPMPRVPYGLPSSSNSGGYGGGGTQFPDWVNRVGQQFGLKPSTYPGHQTSNRSEAGYAPNPQNLNRGIDWTGTSAQMRQLAEWAMQHPDEFEQFIFRDTEMGKDYEIAGGKISPGYFASDLAGHTTHAHTRSSQSFGPDTMGGQPGQSGWGQYSYDGPGQNQQNPMYVQPAKTGGEQLGQDIFSGIGEIFGLGTLFKDPTQFGLFKIFKSIMGLGGNMPDTGQGGQGGGLFGMGGGGQGGGIMGMISSIAQPFGPLQSGSPANAPTEFIPGIGGGVGGGLNLGGLIPTSGGPGGGRDATVVDNRTTFQGNNFGWSKDAVGDQMRERDLKLARPGFRNVPSR